MLQQAAPLWTVSATSRSAIYNAPISSLAASRKPSEGFFRPKLARADQAGC